MTEISDDDLRDEVLTQLRRLPGIAAAHVGVAADRGLVTLSGQVDSFAKKELIQDATLGISGVRAIADALTVRKNLGTISDPDIAREVADIVARATNDPGSSVKAVVRQGVVTLTGMVASSFDHELVVDGVARLKGVKRIYDNVRVDSDAATADIRRAITSRLVHNAQLDSNHIQVEVINGVVTLTGTVRSPDECHQAERAARNAPRIREVRNLLRIGR
ncbi:MAG TPA: BON domain-containing protein [Pseudonocardia sp.]|jgi:osmotically-inducible protein OsmY